MMDLCSISRRTAQAMGFTLIAFFLTSAAHAAEQDESPSAQTLYAKMRGSFATAQAGMKTDLATAMDGLAAAADNLATKPAASSDPNTPESAGLKTAFGTLDTLKDLLAKHLKAADDEIIASMAGEAPQRITAVKSALERQSGSAMAGIESLISEFLAGAGRLKEEALNAKSAEAWTKLAEAARAGQAPLAQAIQTFLDGKITEALAAYSIMQAAEIVGQAKRSSDKVLQGIRDDYLAEFSKSRGVSRIVRCAPDPNTGGLQCLPEGLLISGEEIAEIVISGLPVGKIVHVRAFTGEQIVGQVKARSDPNNQDSKKVKTPVRLSEGCTEVADTSQVLIAIHTDRLIAPTYGLWRNHNAAARRFSEAGPGRILLLTKGQGAHVSLTVSIYGEDAKPDTGCGKPEAVSGKPETVFADIVPLVYERWRFETGAFYGLGWLADESITTHAQDFDQDNDPNTPPVQRARITGKNSNSTSEKTGVFLNFFPRNYPWIGWGVGFSVEPERPPSVFLGPSIRITSIGDRGLASISGGWTLQSVQRFPGADQGQAFLDPADSRLSGVLDRRGAPYVLLQLGFSFGPIQQSD